MMIDPNLPIQTPRTRAAETFTDAAAAVDRLDELYREATHFLIERFRDVLEGARARRPLPRLLPRDPLYHHQLCPDRLRV